MLLQIHKLLRLFYQIQNKHEESTFQQGARTQGFGTLFSKEQTEYSFLYIYALPLLSA